jgi:transposase
LVIALIVNVEGFPLSYETFDGNRADVTSLETVVRMVERKYGRARRVWVFDRGIVSEEKPADVAQARWTVPGGHAAQQAQAVRARVAR